MNKAPPAPQSVVATSNLILIEEESPTVLAKDVVFGSSSPSLDSNDPIVTLSTDHKNGYIIMHAMMGEDLSPEVDEEDRKRGDELLAKSRYFAKIEAMETIQ